MWSLVHFFCCSHCQQYFSAKDFSSCRFHPNPPAASVVVVSKRLGDSDDAPLSSSRSHEGFRTTSQQQDRASPARRSIHLKKDIDVTDKDGASDTIICPYGVYPCCKQPSYQFYPFPGISVQ